LPANKSVEKKKKNDSMLEEMMLTIDNSLQESTKKKTAQVDKKTKPVNTEKETIEKKEPEKDFKKPVIDKTANKPSNRTSVKNTKVDDSNPIFERKTYNVSEEAILNVKRRKFESLSQNGKRETNDKIIFDALNNFIIKYSKIKESSSYIKTMDEINNQRKQKSFGCKIPFELSIELEKLILSSIENKDNIKLSHTNIFEYSLQKLI
jgi:hypothetical protein